MKKVILISIVFLFSLKSYSQFWKNNEKIKLFNLEFKAKEVNGQKGFFGSEDRYYSPVLNPLIEKQSYEFLNNVGTFRKNVGTAETRNLFDLSSLNGNFKHLNQIDFEYYQNKGFDKMISKNPDLIDNSEFLELKNKIFNEPDPYEKKKILFQDKYRDFRLKLVSTRYELNPKNFKLSKEKVSKFTAELKAKVDSTLIANNVQSSGNVRAYLNKLADETTSVSGVYYSVSMNNDYVGVVKSYIENNIESIKESANGSSSENRFSQQLMKFIEWPNAVINSSLVAIQLEGNIENNKVNISEISTALESRFAIPKAKAIEVAASIEITFEKHETIRFNNDFNSVYIIRYFSSDEFNELKQL
ncbi:hypothetical protein [Psychroserpens luteus]|uniref:SEA domain-containing protein n=1 Tax=Psychroserpens luteus TaxID=1434066 RepID=A0ABW5ZVU4_9FLAO|nr:hypothetical protein [Psychroserpens luteus]